jgi:hypothetical protein
MDCAELLTMLDRDHVCEQSDFGAKVATQCLYPSADPVFVHVSKRGDGFSVSDGGDIIRNVLVHGRDDTALKAGLEEARKRHCLTVKGGILYAEVPSADWLASAVMAIANGAALAANVAVDHEVRKAERSLVSEMYKAVEAVVPAQRIAREYEWRGKSGKTWKIDLAVLSGERPLLMKAVTPHHNSISSNYTTFGDIGATETEHFCVYRRSLGEVDASLIRQVATLVPIRSLGFGVQQAIGKLS